MRVRQRERSNLALAAALAVAAPVAAGVIYSVLGAIGLAGIDASGIDLHRIASVLGEPTVWRSTAFSFWVAGAATVLGAAAAVGVAIAFRGNQLTDRIARTLAVAPLTVPYVVAGAVGLMILGQSGYIARLAYAWGWIASPSDMPALVYDPGGIGLIVTLAWKELPFMALVAFSVLGVRGAELEETARMLGAARWAVFTRVTWPILWRGLLPALVAVFVFTFGNYETAAMLAPSDPLPLPMLTLERYSALDLAQRADAYVLTLVALMIGLLAVAVHEWTRARMEALFR